MKNRVLAWVAATTLTMSPLGTASIAAQSSSSTGSMPSTLPDGTRFLVRLEDRLSTRDHKAGKKFKAKTLEPLTTPDGLILPPGAEARGHVSRVEPAGVTGRARMWLAFDEIKTPAGKMPLIADVIDVPGEHSVRSGDSKEGEISARTNHGRQEVEAAAAGAAIGAVIGGTTKGGKGAGIGAAIGGLAGFLVASGMAQEIELQKGTKLELILDRPLYIAKR